ncbi:hypothetical protein GA0115240_138214 [Streptomyces sp. DvalAA-14]|uniref:hypothetical protein n=1 Tax=unclassified Streptomyces TaxID=2593676 RepID=UPI00081BBA67|nr:MULTISPECIES: hypothetical protein [unclassified Streptomyces]MYS22106.1 hypothetical protein [Streptomyces sp. SID4948]SCE08744.1 hypothetical protein GA0115240_138214 [Streptomyces sp. DvalAA-14]
MIDELVNNSYRFAAPSYGYDAATVLGNALAARRRRRARTTAVVVVVVLWAVFGGILVSDGVYGATGFWVSTVLALWSLWAVNLLAAVLERQVVTVHLRRSRRAGEGFDGVPPVPAPGPAGLYDKIRADQSSSVGVVYYGGYVPFIGAGESVRRWSFACLLERARTSLLPPLSAVADRQEPGHGADGIRAMDPDPFTADELTAYMEQRLRSSLLDEVAAHGQRLRGLEVSRCFYAKALGSRAPVPADRLAEYQQAAGEVPDHYNAAREYLCVRVGSWSQELVTSVFLNVDLKGRMIYTQFHGYHLMPIKSAYHEADRQRRLNGAEVRRLAGRVALESAAGLLGGALWALAWPLAIAKALWNRKDLRTATAATTALDPKEEPDYIDWGARRSVREMASGAYLHFFQQMDDEKFIKIIERRTFEVILDFLEDHHVDTTEYRAQQNALNIGILQTGSGTIVNSAAVAAGSQARAS